VNPDPLEDPYEDGRRMKRSIIIAGGFTAILWAIHITALIFGIKLYEYGIYPTQIQGLPGVLLSPLIHSSFSHLLANTAPLVILGTALLYGYPRSARIVIPIV
jgi:membrane associated rhomboid family serine protease